MIKAIKFAGVPVRDQDRADTRLVLFTPAGQENRIGTFANLASK